jgi:ubiquinone/menaquinone biosynthesis C-methylase UbiE
MADGTAEGRRGAIDAAGPLGAIDIMGLAGGEEGWPEGYLKHGFGAETAALRQAVERWGFAGLGRVADVGCGFGRWSPFLAEVNDAVVGYERNARGVALGARLAALFALTNLTFEAADIAALPVPAESFDGAWCCNVLQFTDRGAVLHEINRVLRTGGRLAILKYNGVGGVLETFAAGYARGGLGDRNAQFALRCLRRGPLHDGRDNYGSVDTAARMLEGFGFALAETPGAFFRPGEARGSEIDPQELAARLESDAAFRDEFIKRPDLANAFPVVLDLVTTKVRDLPPRTPARRGAIDAVGPLAAVDLVALAGSEAGWPPGYLAKGFGADAASLRRVVERWGFARLGRVADLGCGYGRWSVFLAEVNEEVVGFETRPAAVALGEKLAAAFGLTNLAFETAELADLPAEAASFDAAWCWNALQFADRGQVLREINRILRLGGRLGVFKYPGVGGVLQTFLAGHARGGLADRAAQFALRCLRRGPRYDGRDNFGSIGTAGPMLEGFGFTLEAGPSVAFDPDGGAEAGADLEALATSLETDEGFRHALAQGGSPAAGFPVALDLVATKSRELDLKELGRSAG